MGFIVAATIFTLRYWILPNIENYHDEVTSLASRALGLPVKIGKIEADLRWFRPHLVFTNIQLMDAEGRSALDLKRVDNVVSWMTLLSSELRLQALEIDDPDLQIRRDKQGLLFVAGLQISGHSKEGKLSDWLLHQSHINLNNGRVTWLDDLNNRPALVFNQVEMKLNNSGKHHRFAVRISPPVSVADPFEARGDLVGDSFSNLSAWRGELYAQLSHADLGAWETWIKLPDEFSHAKGSLRVWLGVEGGQFNKITADLDMSEVQSRLATNLPQLDLVGLRGRIGWHQLVRGFEVSATKLALETNNGFKLKPTDFNLRLVGTKETPFAAGQIQANVVDLGDLTVMADYIPMGKSFKQNLADFSPSGRIFDLLGQWQDNGHFDIKARFDNLTISRVDKIPGVAGLSGEVNGNDSSGVISLNSPHLKLDAPQFFLEPLTFDTFSAQTGWQHKRDGWDIKLNNFSLSNEDLTGTAFGNYQTETNGLGVVDVTLNLTHASIRHVVNYVPKDLLGKSTVAWMQSALLGGVAEDAHLHLRGNLNDFPFTKNKNGFFRVEAKTKDVVIDFAKEWPRVENEQGSLLIENSRIQVVSNSATMAGYKAQKGSALIPDFMSPEPQVEISGEASLQTKQVLNFIRHSPIRGYTNGVTDKTIATGMGKLDLQLLIPLTGKPVKVNGNYHFTENDIDFGEAIPLAKAVNGDLQFSESTIQGQDIVAQIYGGPAMINLQTESDGTIKGTIKGNINADIWHKIEPSSWLQSFKGSTEWNAEGWTKNSQIDVRVSSNMQGITSNLPAPLRKQTRDIVPLKFEYKNLSASQDLITVQYGDIVSTKILRSDDKLGNRSIRGGYMDFGPTRHVVEKEGIWIAGTLPMMSLEGWSGAIPAKNGKEMSVPMIDGIDVTAQKLVGYGSSISGVNIHARNHGGTVTAQLMSKDLAGEVSWFTQGRGKVVARLKNAILGQEEKENKSDIPPTAQAPVIGKAPGNVSIPVIDIVVEHFTYHGKQLGRLELNASQIDKDILLDHLRVENPDGVATVNGKWGLSPSQTHVAVKLELYDTGKMLNRSGYPNMLKDGNGTLDGDLVWSGAPDEFALGSLDGHLNLKMKKGQFLQVDPGAGKLLSVMNLQSLPKRIALDFTDVFSKGFEFDDIAGAAQIRQGMLMTNDFQINGSSAQVTMSGQVDLKRETQSLRVRVLPTIGGSVSLLAFAAGPAIGAGVFLANKIFRDPLDKLVSFEYNVTGSWADPKVEKVGQVKAIPNNINN